MRIAIDGTAEFFEDQRRKTGNQLGVRARADDDAGQCVRFPTMRTVVRGHENVARENDRLGRLCRLCDCNNNDNDRAVD